MNTTDITRQLVTSSMGGTALDGFTLEADESGWTISDGRDESHETDPADALRTYADFIETFIDDQDEDTAAKWQAEIDQARADAEKVQA